MPESDGTCSIGTIIMWTLANIIPDGWLKCDGEILEINSAYNDLYNIIGNSFGNQAVSGIFDPSTQFYLPDLRGYFIRGIDEGVGRDPNSASRADMQSATTTYTGVGSVQLDEFASHNHGGLSFVNANNQSSFGNDGSGKFGTIADNTGGNETRPKNAYLYFIIKY